MMNELKGKRALVTGGCGFIGLHMVERLLKEGVSGIVVIDSAEYGAVTQLPKDPRVMFVQEKLESMNTDALKARIGSIDYLIHLAAYKHNQSAAHPERFLSGNIVGTYNAITLAVAAGATRAVFSSSLYAYGRMSGGPMQEDELPQPTTLYGISKLAGERLFAWANKEHGLTYNIVRYFFVYGPRQYPGMGYKSVIIKNFERMLRGEPPIIRGDGLQSLDYIYVADAVEGTLCALLSANTGVISNIGSGNAISINDLTAHMRTIAGYTGEVVPEPADETAGTVRVADTTQTKEMLGFSTQTPLEVGLRETYEWLRDTTANR